MEEKKYLTQREKNEKNLIDNAEEMFLCPDPVFLVNESPTASHLATAQEMNVPVVVIMTKDKFPDMGERMLWQVMNIPDLDYVCVEWAGDHSNVPFIKNKWKKIVIRQREEARNKELGLASNSPLDSLFKLLKYPPPSKDDFPF